VLVTGHTGFKGGWLSRLLVDLDADVTGYALAPDPPGGAFEQLDLDGRMQSVIGDIRDRDALARVLADGRPEIVFHLAAQALVHTSFTDPIGTYDVNVTGTAAVLAAVTAAPGVRVAVVVTSDKVYENDGTGRAFVESDRLGGGDPYSASKAAAELVVASWRHSFTDTGTPTLVTARAGNVIGGGDRAAHRLLPDLFRALTEGQDLLLRHPESVRPWQFVLDPASGYLGYAEAAWADPRVPASLNFGPGEEAAWSVEAVVERVISLAGEGSWRRDGAPPVGPEAAVLRLDASLARRCIGWSPTVDLDTALDWTVAWYRAERGLGSVSAVADGQIAAYLERVTA
jgi:CDP-glucose 4,6-dehydratase